MVTLNKPAAGDTDWTTEINDNWTSLETEVIDKSTVDAKGDLLSGTAADAVARVAVGTNGQVLTADSAETAGIKWAAAGGGAATEVDSWRLEFTSATSLTLLGIGDGGGKITINGEVVSFTTDPTLSNGGLAASTLFRIYAFKSGSTVALEASTTAADVEKYGVYGRKTGDNTRRLVGLIFTNASSQFTDDMVRSNLNEIGYGFDKEEDTDVSVSTTSTAFVDISTFFQMFALFWDDERVELWGNTQASELAAVVRVTVLAMELAGVTLNLSELGTFLEASSTATPSNTLRVTAIRTNSGAGRKEIRVRFRTSSGNTAQVIMGPDEVNGMGFQVIR